MIRAIFFSFGLFVTLCGVAMLFVDRVVLTDYAGRKVREAAGPIAASDQTAEPRGWKLVYASRRVEEAGAEMDPPRQVIDPPDWAAFGLLSAGGVTVLYALALPGRRNGDEEE
jgi:hypothetical protein